MDVLKSDVGGCGRLRLDLASWIRQFRVSVV